MSVMDLDDSTASVIATYNNGMVVIDNSWLDALSGTYTAPSGDGSGTGYTLPPAEQSVLGGVRQAAHVNNATARTEVDTINALLAAMRDAGMMVGI